MEDTIELDENLIAELSKSIKTQAGLAKLSQILLKTTVERALDVEMGTPRLRKTLARRS